jgi:hypothetical protein
MESRKFKEYKFVVEREYRKMATPEQIDESLDAEFGVRIKQKRNWPRM